MALNATQVAQLKEFVKVLKTHPEILHEDRLSFFKEYLVSLGASIPEKPKHEEKHQSPKHSAPEPGFEDMPDLDEAEAPEPVHEEPEEEIEEEPVDPTVIPPESDEPQPMGDPSKEVSDDDRDKAQELRGKATELIGSGDIHTFFYYFDIQEAINVLTEAITKHNGASAPLHASRAQCYLRLKKPVSAIRDADAAIKINPDSAAAFRVRGRAKALLGQWSAAAADLKAANQRDYDPEVNDILKEVSAKAELAAARQKKIDEQKKRREAKNKPAGGASKGPGGPGGPGGIPSWMPPDLLGKLMQDPEVLAAIGDPEVMPILTQLMKDPSGIEKYKDHPKLGKLISKFAGLFPTPPQ